MRIHARRSFPVLLFSRAAKTIHPLQHGDDALPVAVFHHLQRPMAGSFADGTFIVLRLVFRVWLELQAAAVEILGDFLCLPPGSLRSSVPRASECSCRCRLSRHVVEVIRG